MHPNAIWMVGKSKKKLRTLTSLSFADVNVVILQHEIFAYIWYLSIIAVCRLSPAVFFNYACFFADTIIGRFILFDIAPTILLCSINIYI